MRTAIAVVLYYVGLLLGGLVAWLILALLIRRLDNRGRSTRNRRRTHRSVAAPAAPSVEARVQRVGRPYDVLDELMHNLADEGGEILLMERMNERSW